MADGIKQPSSLSELITVLTDPNNRAASVGASGAAAAGLLGGPPAAALGYGVGAGVGLMADTYHRLSATQGSGLSTFLNTLKATQNPRQLIHDAAVHGQERSRTDLSKSIRESALKAGEPVERPILAVPDTKKDTKEYL